MYQLLFNRAITACGDALVFLGTVYVPLRDVGFVKEALDVGDPLLMDLLHQPLLGVAPGPAGGRGGGEALPEPLGDFRFDLPGVGLVDPHMLEFVGIDLVVGAAALGKLLADIHGQGAEAVFQGDLMAGAFPASGRVGQHRRPGAELGDRLAPGQAQDFPVAPGMVRAQGFQRLVSVLQVDADRLVQSLHGYGGRRQALADGRAGQWPGGDGEQQQGLAEGAKQSLRVRHGDGLWGKLPRIGQVAGRKRFRRGAGAQHAPRPTALLHRDPGGRGAMAVVKGASGPRAPGGGSGGPRSHR